MTVKKNETIAVMAQEQAYQISAWKAVSILAGSVLISVVGTAFALAGTLNSDHFLTVSNTDRISAIEKTTVRQDVLFEQLKPMSDDISEMKADIKLLLRESTSEKPTTKTINYRTATTTQLASTPSAALTGLPDVL